MAGLVPAIHVGPLLATTGKLRHRYSRLTITATPDRETLAHVAALLDHHDVDGRDKPTAVRFDFYGQGAWR